MLEVDQINLATEYDKNTLEELGRDVVAGFKLDWASRSEWMRNNQEWLDLVTQYNETRSWPWPNAANIKYPLVAIAALQFQSRISALILNNGNMVRGRVIGYDPTGEKMEKSVRIGKHMTWQITEQMDEWQDQMNRLLMVVPIIGTAFKKTFFDPVTERNRSIYVSPTDLVINYHAESLSKAPRVSHVLFESKTDVEEKVRKKVYLDVRGKGDEYSRPGTDPSEVMQDRADRDRRLGLVEPSTTDDTKPFVYLEQITRRDLDGDGYCEPVLVTVEYHSAKVVRILPFYEAKDVQTDEKGEIVRIEPSEMYTKFGFVPNPDSAIYDLGFGQLIGPLNISINSIINQLLDAGTMNNLQAGFLGRGISLPKGQMGLQPGQWMKVNSTVDDISKAILPLPTKEPSQVLFSLLGYLVDAGRQLASTTDIMLGENPGQNQPAATTMAVMENGLNVFGALWTTIHRHCKHEYRLLFKLNSKYLNEREYFAVLDGRGQDQVMSIGLNDYDTDSFDVVPASDPNVVSATQKLIKINALKDTAQRFGTINTTELTRREVEAMEIANPDTLVLPPPNPQPSDKVVTKQMELEWEFKKWMEERQLREVTAQGEATKDLAVAQLAISKAASEDQNREMAPINREMDVLLEIVKNGASAGKNAQTKSPKTGGTETDVAQTGGEMSGGTDAGVGV